jgi:hypothetical protein
MLPSVIISKGLVFAAAGSWLTSGALLVLVHQRLSSLNKRQARQIEQLQQQQQTLEAHLVALRQQATPSVIQATPVSQEQPVVQQIPAAKGTKGAFLQDLLNSNLKLQQDIKHL